LTGEFKSHFIATRLKTNPSLSGAGQPGLREQTSEVHAISILCCMSSDVAHIVRTINTLGSS